MGYSSVTENCAERNGHSDLSYIRLVWDLGLFETMNLQIGDSLTPRL